MKKIHDVNAFVAKIYQDYCNSDSTDQLYLQEFSDAYGNVLLEFVSDLKTLYRQLTIDHAWHLRIMLDDSRIHWHQESKAKLLEFFDAIADGDRRHELLCNLGVLEF